MASGKEIKNRIKSVKNTKKITKAMELVAASKMKRAVANTLASRIYAKYSWEILQYLSKTKADDLHPLFKKSNGEKILMVVITSNRGLCGAYNAQVMRAVIAYMKENPQQQIDFITIGKKGEAMLRRLGKNIIASFTENGETVILPEVMPIANYVVEEFLKGGHSSAQFIYTDFVSALSQNAKLRQLLPISPDTIRKLAEDSLEGKLEEEKSADYVFEPNYDILVSNMVGKIAKMQVYQMFLESSASEQSSRMVAMKNASEAAGEMINELTLAFNKARQASITQEISEISAGVASVS